MNNPFTESEEYKYRQYLYDKAREKEQQMREDAMDCFDDGDDDE
jgi:hypothetical protein